MTQKFLAILAKLSVKNFSTFLERLKTVQVLGHTQVGLGDSQP